MGLSIRCHYFSINLKLSEVGKRNLIRLKSNDTLKNVRIRCQECQFCKGFVAVTRLATLHDFDKFLLLEFLEH